MSLESGIRGPDYPGIRGPDPRVHGGPGQQGPGQQGGPTRFPLKPPFVVLLDAPHRRQPSAPIGADEHLAVVEFAEQAPRRPAIAPHHPRHLGGADPVLLAVPAVQQPDHRKESVLLSAGEAGANQGLQQLVGKAGETALGLDISHHAWAVSSGWYESGSRLQPLLPRRDPQKRGLGENLVEHLRSPNLSGAGVENAE